METADKPMWRGRVREWVRAMSFEEKASSARRLRESLAAQPIWTGASRVLCFAPLDDEPDIMPLIEKAWQQGKIVALPRFDGARECYCAARVRDASELRVGRFGAREPDAGCAAADLKQLDLILVPGVAFDLTGRRLGRGKGFYDRLLAEVRGHKCGVAFDRQLVAELPEEPHDVRVDSILTPSQWLPARAD